MGRALTCAVAIVLAIAIPLPSWIDTGQRLFAQKPSQPEPSQPEPSQPEPEHMYTNQLAGETSPYLLQHAHNPVNWYPWGEEAFEKARRENKPIFLSVGYSTCYWCHVMEVQSFEDPEVAEVLNKYCVAIKVDREERPDIDEQYMLATQLMTGRGGWPNSVWLTPDGKPWMAGTYFPKPRFIAVLNQIHQFWVNRREDVDRQANALTEAAKRMNTPPDAATVQMTSGLVTQATAKLMEQFDPVNGGFGGAPKFPPHGTLALLIRQYQISGDASLLPPITKTLDAMWLGGMHDHLGGGFHRYATDSVWLLPHFEKMLYDNAQLMRIYADAHQLSGEGRYRQAVADIFRWVQREMTSPAGAFYSALDSGEVGKEGEAYVWSMDKLNAAVGDEDAKLFAEVYNFVPAGNFEEESTGAKTGENIPHLKQPIEAAAKQHPLGESAFTQRLQRIESALLADRLTWPQPHKDDKVLTSWNGLMIDALAHAGRVLDEPQYIAAASRAADFILTSMVRDGKLLRTYRDGTAKLPGYLDDYAYFCSALVELHQATGDARWLNEAVRHADFMLREFEDEQNGGFYFTGDSHEALMVRSKNLGGGGNMPNTNGIAAQVLIQLSDLTGNVQYRDAARRTLESMAVVMSAQPHTSEHLLIGVSQYLERGGDQAGPITISATASKPKVAAGEDLLVKVEITIADGWHLYAENPGVDFVRPTKVSLQADLAKAAADVVDPPAETKLDPVLEKTLKTYRGRIEFQIPVIINADANPGPSKLQVIIDSQACDDTRCLQPQTTTIEIPIEITP